MRKAIVIDLDGTLLNTNTFICYIIFICKIALLKGDFFSVCRVVLLIFLRKIRIISSHENFKKKILTCLNKYSNERNMKDFSVTMYKYENQRVISLLNKYRELGYATLLSSAAPETYVEVIASHYLFDFKCATPKVIDSNWRENVGEFKKYNTLSLLKRNSLVMSVLVTDHYDDLPLLQINKDNNFIVNPTDKTRRKIEEKHVNCKFIYGK